ncbi:hypothetical protein [Phaeovulum sp.]|uniref:hypothetical protein n=1 Tax=Phaeovulum sp. TaxID=2934796 RepID=UPI00272FC520|nr:hypothetical protein [Phaeovulum sp.]MDP1670431.1 hypothetical protein [Phaeovulum sp.]MDZ4120756.1 hypothetical protein [Phaeovulum sp.]
MAAPRGRARERASETLPPAAAPGGLPGDLPDGQRLAEAAPLAARPGPPVEISGGRVGASGACRRV